MADQAPVLSLLNVSHSFLSRPVLKDVNLTIHEGERAGLLGVNGAGKSTMMRIIAGAIKPDSGEIRARRELTIGYLDQSFILDPDATVRQWVEGAMAPIHAIERELDDVHHKLAEPHSEETGRRLLERQAALTHELEHRGAYDATTRIEVAMAALGLPPHDRIISSLSGGEQRRVALCRTLLERPDLLLLDEPTNHLDAETLEWLEDFLRTYPGTVVLVTHDRYFLDRVADRMIELSQGQVRVYTGNYEEYLIQKDTEWELLRRDEDNRQRLLRTELVWLGRQPKARTTKSKSRIASIETMMATAPPVRDESLALRLPDGPRLGNVVLECEHIKRSLGGRQLVNGFTFTMVPGDRVGILGRNGVGKTTLLKMMLRVDRPDAGAVKHGQNLKAVYSDQHRAKLDPEKSVLEEVAGDVEWVRIGDERVSVRQFLRRFLFTDEMAAMPIKRLSGGERNRVMLAKLLREGGNLVALDEPTNDLDLMTLRVLEEALVEFDGCAIIVSHDRYFLNRVVTRILWMPGDGEVHEITGNYDDFRLYRARLLKAREEEAKRSPAVAVASAPKGVEASRGTSRKLTFNEQREFDGMEERILALEERHATADALLNDPQTYAARKREEIAQLEAERRETAEAVERLYARWAELSERA